MLVWFEERFSVVFAVNKRALFGTYTFLSSLLIAVYSSSLLCSWVCMCLEKGVSPRVWAKRGWLGGWAKRPKAMLQYTCLHRGGRTRHRTCCSAPTESRLVIYAWGNPAERGCSRRFGPVFSGWKLPDWQPGACLRRFCCRWDHMGMLRWQERPKLATARNKFEQ